MWGSLDIKVSFHCNNAMKLGKSFPTLTFTSSAKFNFFKFLLLTPTIIGKLLLNFFWTFSAKTAIGGSFNTNFLQKNFGDLWLSNKGKHGRGGG